MRAESKIVIIFRERERVKETCARIHLLLVAHRQIGVAVDRILFFLLQGMVSSLVLERRIRGVISVLTVRKMSQSQAKW